MNMLACGEPTRLIHKLLLQHHKEHKREANQPVLSTSISRVGSFFYLLTKATGFRVCFCENIRSPKRYRILYGFSFGGIYVRSSLPSSRKHLGWARCPGALTGPHARERERARETEGQRDSEKEKEVSSSEP